MKIYVATGHFQDSINRLFSNVGGVELLPTNYRNIPDFSADILIFAGGSDINPKMYTDLNNVSPADAPYIDDFYDDKRDTWEVKLMKDFIKGTLKVKKVLGICRGLQLVNVAFGGSLVYDIWSKFGDQHDPSHPIKHLRETPLNFLVDVNSMHHQGLDFIDQHPRIGDYSVIAIEPKTGIPEIVSWGNSVLGVQFHPEFFSDSNPNKKNFVKVMEEWVSGDVAFGRDSKKEKKSAYDSIANYTYRDVNASVARVSNSLTSEEVVLDERTGWTFTINNHT